MKIKEINFEERPRERLINNYELSNAELLAILLRSGSKEQNSIDLAQTILSSFKDINELDNLTYNHLINIKGIGPAKATNILAAIALGKRIFFSSKKNDTIIKCPKDIVNIFKNDFINLKQEYFYVLFLDTKKAVISNKLLFKGTLNMSIVHPREIFKEAYLNSASSIVCVHNHPSGDVTPSTPDKEITNKISEIGKLMGVKLVDHIIIGNDNYYSFLEHGLII